jgi:hypothetical protein
MPREPSSEGKSRPQAIAAYLSGHTQPLRLLLGRTAPLTRLAASGVVGPVVQDLSAGWTETILEQPWHPTARITSRSSMPSARAAVPAMIELTLPAGFTAAEATRVVPGLVTTLADTRSDSPARPAHHRHQTARDTKPSSSNAGVARGHQCDSSPKGDICRGPSAREHDRSRRGPNGGFLKVLKEAPDADPGLTGAPRQR